MTRYQGQSKRSISGGSLRKGYEKKKRELGRPAAATQIAEERKRFVRTWGGNRKIRLYRTTKVNVMDPETGKAKQAVIKDVATNPASREYSRRRIITKGAILETDLGKVRVSNRPGNEGFVNGVLITEE